MVWVLGSGSGVYGSVFSAVKNFRRFPGFRFVVGGAFSQGSTILFRVQGPFFFEKACQCGEEP